ncbi:MAG: PDZ domain-containing protein [Verrucomicrobiota bacterium]|nr:PDZ domain-containing protein [Verrucomicrobiota bacterium]
MKTRTIVIITAAGLLPLSGFSEPTPATPAVPAVPAVPGVPAVPAVPPVPAVNAVRDRGPKVPVTYLGVETSEVPSVVAEQLGLPKGFGLVVDYVMPDGPAAAAGVQPNDIIKMLNDQIMVDTDQLSKLIRSYNEGASVTLTILRKGTETKVTAKLQKREIQMRRDWERHMHNGERFGLGSDFEQKMQDFGEQMKNMQLPHIEETVRAAREQARVSRDQARQMAEQARQMAKGMRVITSNDNGAIKTTKIDLGKAEISYSDNQGEMQIEVADGKKFLTAKDPQGKLLFSGPISTPEELNKVPAEVRQRYEKLEQKDLPAIRPNFRGAEADENNDNDNDADMDEDNNSGGDEDAVEHISTPAMLIPFPYRHLGINTVLI